MQNDPVMAVLAVFCWHSLEQVLLDRVRRFSVGQAKPAGNTENMGIDRNGGFAKSTVKDDIRRLPSHTGQLLQGFTLARYLTLMQVEQTLTRSDNVFGLATVQANGFDVVDKPYFA